MEMQFLVQLIVNSLLLGAGLAMDAFSMSIANGLAEPSMKKGRMCMIAGIYALFQFGMPLIGWFIVHTVAEMFQAFQPFIPWISFVLLLYIGGKMIWESLSNKSNDKEEEKKGTNTKKLTLGVLLLQGIATSIDALSVGFSIADYDVYQACISSLIIGVVTFLICFAGLAFGRKIGEKFADIATVIGGIILIGIGIEIVVTSFL